MSFTTTSTPVPRGSYIVKFRIDEFVFDLQAKIWRIIAIKNITTNPIFTCESTIEYNYSENTQVVVRDFYEDELFPPPSLQYHQYFLLIERHYKILHVFHQ